MRYERRAVLRGAGAALATLATAGCAGDGSSDGTTVEMTNDFRFEPATLRVGAGATVRWENTSGADHTVTAYGDRIPEGAAYFASGGFASERAARNDVRGGLVPPGGTYEHAFETPGTYEYFCIPHESSGMIGTVRVE